MGIVTADTYADKRELTYQHPGWAIVGSGDTGGLMFGRNNRISQTALQKMLQGRGPDATPYIIKASNGEVKKSTVRKGYVGGYINIQLVEKLTEEKMEAKSKAHATNFALLETMQVNTPEDGLKRRAKSTQMKEELKKNFKPDDRYIEVCNCVITKPAETYANEDNETVKDANEVWWSNY